MVSNTKQTKKIRRRHLKKGGKRRKNMVRRTGGTPAFPIHPEGYDPSAPDAKSVPETGDATKA
ncbi:MAG: hypothetical protein DRI90_17255 [Deltaproteobacteria bacterium]|nr:MAG: hypothetical protein DRI90_17255 [Deltaproteobacteria bacterium]